MSTVEQEAERGARRSVNPALSPTTLLASLGFPFADFPCQATYLKQSTWHITLSIRHNLDGAPSSMRWLRLPRRLTSLNRRVRQQTCPQQSEY